MTSSFLTPLRKDKIVGTHTYWFYKCGCGKIKSIRMDGVRSGHVQSCGCRLHKLRDILGREFNRLKVIQFKYIKKSRDYWLCLCICGKSIVTSGIALLKGKTKSCGCLILDVNRKIKTTHGFSPFNLLATKDQVAFYRVWCSMMDRCYNPKNKNYLDYGGRGITVCERWHKFENFRDDMWESFLEHKRINTDDTSIERIAVMGNYKPSNCTWATNEEQNRNRRSSIASIDPAMHKLIIKRFGSRLTDIIKLERPCTDFCNSYLKLDSKHFRSYIKSLWVSGMTWDNYGPFSPTKRTWHISHILGCNNFDLAIETDRLDCYNYKNFQPKWAIDNLTENKIRKCFIEKHLI